MKALFVLMFVSSAALADDGALLRCRALADGPARLSCYDAIPATLPPPGGQPLQAGQAAPSGQAAPAAAAPYAPQYAPSREQLEQAFGKEPPALQPLRLASLDSHIVGSFDGWVANQTIRLANGQLWRVVDGSDDVLDAQNPKVTLQRGLLGAIYLDIDGAHRRPRVQRLQ
ncbi:hypothetical protein ACFOLJ_00625 [Rugamonas sp. CCM 8940]|uniref:hypothetical protein n=1 Tax=Rugamonas sp. CCM 8940 TaxID=2765359 RepID=UPI0018F6CE7E|nr:hypothetical protein [Rugamonas sp. CCM 8940]MBJ7308868.1 hypothetical protein [Rugamonas sp. CCM 8940]